MTKQEQINSHDVSQRPYSEDNFDGYRAAPLLIVGENADEQLIEAQNYLAWLLGFAAAHELDKYEYVNHDLLKYISTAISGRMQQREGRNGEEYMRRLHHETLNFEAVPDATISEVEDACKAALYGKGTILQNDMARRAFGMASAEYANLTIIGAFRKNLEVPMWNEVGELAGVDATPRFDQMTNFKLLGFNKDISENPFVDAIRIGMKREIGTLDDGTQVKGRTTAIISLHPGSEFSLSDAHGIYDAAREKTDMKDVPEFQRAVRWLVDEKPKPGVVLARNETVYGFRQATLDEIMQIKGLHYNP